MGLRIKLRWHDLRSTFCTLLLKNNYSEKAISMLMGNAKEIIAIDLYGDNTMIIEGCVNDMQPFIDDVLTGEEYGKYKAHTDTEINIKLLEIAYTQCCWK